MKYMLVLVVFIYTINFNTVRAENIEYKYCSPQAKAQLLARLKWRVKGVPKEEETEVLESSMLNIGSVDLRVAPVEENVEQGLCFLKYLLAKGNKEARNELIFYYARKGQDRDYARKLAEEGAKSNSKISQYYLYNLMDANEKVDGKDRVEWLTISHSQGYLPATCDLGGILIFNGKTKKGFDLMLTAAKKNIVTCQYRVALAYFEGKGISQSYCDSMRWAIKAAKLYDKKALNFLQKNKTKFSNCASNNKEK